MAGFNRGAQLLRIGAFPQQRRGIVSLKSTKLRDVQSKPINKANEGPARTRFAPSPTGFVHLGSLRTALYNYLWARRTGGQFLLRLEDTDQKRLVPGAEENIYSSLKWAGLEWDEGPDGIGGEFGPYRQSDRSAIYAKHAATLMDRGHAYRCFCSKERLDGLRESAKKLHPPSMASYDRKCANLTRVESDVRAENGEAFTVRFKSPVEYPKFIDQLHGTLNLQTQLNFNDLRHEDPVLVKSDGLPTYHLANVVDDYTMKITHVIRGEEWLASAPKHIALYKAFGWTPPKFVHIPLLTSSSEKKLSKRSGDTGISQLAAKGILPEALVNFVALFGWSPPGKNDVFTLKELEEQFSLDALTKGNAKVDDKKLMHFNQVFFKRRLADPAKRQKIISQCHEQARPYFEDSNSDINDSLRSSMEYTERVLDLVSERISSPVEFAALTEYLYKNPASSSSSSSSDRRASVPILQQAVDVAGAASSGSDMIRVLVAQGFDKKQVLQALRLALAGGVSGVKIPDIIDILGTDVVKSRINQCIIS